MMPGPMRMLLLVGVLAACAAPPADDRPPAADSAVAAEQPLAEVPSPIGVEWMLAALGERLDPRGAGGRPVTLQFDSTGTRAAGFAGCNRYSAGYTMSGDSLTFQAAIATKMACTDGMDVEMAYLAALDEVRTYQLSDSTLVLNGAAGTIARFRAP